MIKKNLELVRVCKPRWTDISHKVLIFDLVETEVVVHGQNVVVVDVEAVQSVVVVGQQILEVHVMVTVTFARCV